MNSILQGIGKAMSIWPDEDYEQFVPKRRASESAWLRMADTMNKTICQIEETHPELVQVKSYRRRQNGEWIQIQNKTQEEPLHDTE